MKMRQRFGLILALAATLLLPACSPEELAAGDIFTKSMEASAELNSMTAKMDMNMKMSQGEMNLDLTSDIEMEAIVKPDLAMHQKVDMKMMGQETSTDMYMNKDGIYLKNPLDGTWMKAPVDVGIAEQLKAAQEQMDPAKQLEKLKPYMKDLQLTEGGDKDHYVIKLSTSGEGLKEFVMNEMKNSAGGMGVDEAAEAMKNMTINKLDVTYAIDKKTYYPETIDMAMDFSMIVEGQTAAVNMQVKVDYTGFNNVNEIKIPEEALQ